MLLQLEEMVACTTVDATAVYQRAAQALASVIGDAVTVSLREADGSLRLAAFDHSDPERAVAMGAMLRFGNPDEPLYSRRAAETGEAVFVPQVPQREVRGQVRPEFHQALTTAGFYSAVSAPIVGSGVVRGSVLASRDTPGRPYTIEDRDFVVAVALRIGAAVAQAERGHAAWSLRARLANDLGEWVGHGDFDRAREWLMDEVADGEPVAVINLDMYVDAATTAFADHFGTTASDLKEESMRDVVEDADAVADTFDRLRAGEFDYCTQCGPARRPWSHAGGAPRRDHPPRRRDAVLRAVRRARGPRRRTRLNGTSPASTFRPRDGLGPCDRHARRAGRGRDRRHR